MIKATELRIGNYITYQGKQITVEGVSVSGYIYHSKGQFDGSIGSAYVPFEPIPLTEDWLVRFGFEKEVKQSDSVYISDNVYRLNIFEYATSCGTMNLEIDYYDQHASFTTNIKYVHQLQNLYFYLTGEELILK
jgi:hypothetical protein